MNGLDESGRRLLRYLVGKLPMAVSNRPETFISYKDVHDELGLPMQGPYGASLKGQGLVSLAEWTVKEGLPAITGLIIDRESREPGNGYFELLGEKKNRYARWALEIEQSKNFDWSSYTQDESESGTAVLEGIDEERSNDSTLPTTSPAVWRLIAHHDRSEEALSWMKANNAIAVGWTDVGDLRSLTLNDASDLTREISSAFGKISNAHLGGPSLWNFFQEMNNGDLVIVNTDKGRMSVFSVLGDYFFVEKPSDVSYGHQRAATLTNIDAEKLWSSLGGEFAQGENSRWTLARCSMTDGARHVVYEEGRRFEVRSTAIERSPAARRACLDHFGPTCVACGFNFLDEYGEMGDGFIHVHHRSDISSTPGPYSVDPIKHLVPLCPNCHAMVHRSYPAMDVDALKKLLQFRRKQN